MPDLTGLTGEQASQALRRADFHYIDYSQNRNATMSSRVVSQNPAPGTRWNKLDKVSVALAPSTAASTARTTVAAAPTTTQAPEPVSDTWTYKVTGPHKAMITYAAKGGNTSQVSSAKLPWSKSVESPGYASMSFAYVSAQNSGGGTISCQIIAPSGNVVSENSSEGEYAIVTCQS
ncbi:PASTA domain-containing protein [Pseudonocardia bannensis]|uniref:PASTA domain-containing protein n=2 Tax=Pseudonocardia bannensis TaxID=630973 RepID=A0A848DLV0_9PSEU|nr:PASTA domain-containing protein [Pseudonocardia bannensis]